MSFILRSSASTAQDISDDEARSRAICRHIEVLAGDDYQGRKPGTAGEEKTIGYIREQFMSIGLMPGNGDSYFQEVRLADFSTISPGRIAINTPLGEVEWQYPGDFLLASGKAAELSRTGECVFVFAGFGIYAPEIGWDDYAGLDVRGKIVIVLGETPAQHGADTTRWKGDPAANLYGKGFYKRNEAASRGAVGLLTVYRPSPQGYYTWEGLAESYGRNNLQIKRDTKATQLDFWGLIQPAALKRLFESCGKANYDWKASALAAGFQAFELAASTGFSFTNTWKELVTQNVAGLIPGSDRADEAILYTAHWDHVGTGANITGDSVYNGAVDNASGTAAIIEIARAWKALPVPPRRSILFIATTAEEMGLLGAVWYAAHPLFPTGKTAAAFNMDAHFPYGKTTHITGVVYGRSDLDVLLETAAAEQGRVLVPNTEQNISQDIFFRSDHFPMTEVGIPAEFAVGAGEAKGHDNQVWEQKMSAYMSKYHQITDEYEPDFDCSGIWQDAWLVFRAGQLADRSNTLPMWHSDQPFQRFREKAIYETPHFRDVSRSHLPLMSLQGRSMDARPADLDNDRDLDLVIANEWAYNIILINDGSGKFSDESQSRLPLVRHDSEDIAIEDFDGDGDQDIIFVSEDDQINEYYENDGKGFFKDVSYKLPVTGISNAVACSDLNGDGRPDLIIGNAGQNNCLINDGKGGWRDETDTRLPVSEKTTQDMEFGDIDGDGDLDLIVGNEDDNELWINDGKGIFKDETVARLPLAAGKWETREVDFGDVDNDGDLDIFFANVHFQKAKDSQNRLFLNDGKGFFTDATATKLPAKQSHTVDGDIYDIDGDGNPDLIACNAFGHSYEVYLNDGKGNFSEQTIKFIPVSVSGDGIDAEMADFNGDGQPDLYLCNFQGSDFLLFGKPSPPALSIDEILDKHAEAMGGRDTWKQLKTWKIVNTTANGRKTTEFARKPDRYKLVFEYDGNTLIKSYDGREGWLQHNGVHEQMRPGEALEMAEEPDFYDELMFAREKGYRIALKGKTFSEGQWQYHIEMNKKPGDAHQYFLNTRSFLIDRSGEYSEDPEHKGIYYQTLFRDYRPVNGMMFPRRWALQAGQNAPVWRTVKQIQINLPLKDDVFSKQ
ncbi:MAG: M20/M25/M40 family metallo-hydrolase [Saprospiraceae bacterium]|nr:M20/M25/M40 family metallo-hydrolase [Saprospiraceae bacterium]MCB9306987.1 M20/M25/M40 family metallo-hydrolase [Lewinellaceae bacterium]